MRIHALFSSSAPATMWSVLVAGFFGSTLGWAAGLVAAPDLAYTVPNQPVTITVLNNDAPGNTNSLGLLHVSTPAHGTVRLNSNPVAADPELLRLFQFAGRQLSNSVLQVADTNAYPRNTLTNGTWRTSPAGDWISGFFPGTLWYLYEQTAEARFRNWAESWTIGIASQQYVTNTPDLGFMVYNSFGAGYRLTENPAYAPVIVQAARSVVAGGWNPTAGVIGQLRPDNTLAVGIDWMMDLELLFRASAMSGDRTLYTNALRTAEKMMADNVRADGSTYQTTWYDAATGALVHQGTSDGASDDSTWARGQAWATYGFTMTSRETGDLRFLATAQRLADWFLAHVPADQVPYWDFQAPGIPNAPKDSSASAIMLPALVELSQIATNQQDRVRYWQAAGRLFDSLRSTNYLAQGSTSNGILLHGTGEPPKFFWAEVDVSLAYGDYYFIEALQRYTRLYRQTTITYEPSPDFQGTDTFTYEVGNSAGECASATVTVQADPTLTNRLAATIALSPNGRIPALSFLSLPERRYFVQYATNLPGPWNLLATNLTGTGSFCSISDTNASARRFYRVGMEPPVSPQSVTLAASAGVVTSPFIVVNGHVFQAFETGLTNGGEAVYRFSVSSPGTYEIAAVLDAPNNAANSFFVNVDAEPQDPYMIWDIPLTTGFEERAVSWRGNGTFDNNEFVPKLFNLAAGWHQLIIRGREPNTRLQSITIRPTR